jgi:propionyl-CoA carboxylase alpha chain
MHDIKKVLVANRGEIAVRIINSARKMGIKTVAVYSEADRLAPFVTLSDESYFLGPSPSSESYLKGDKIIKIALESGAQAIHPGYGFLSENSQFAQNVASAGLIFIGPGKEAIEMMGDKLASKAAVKNYDIPMVPGIDKSIDDVEEAKSIATEIGYPVLIKASAGGGGKGMRIVNDEASLESQMKRAISEAISAFGNGSVFVEKFVEQPRHIEIQVLFDQFGQGIYLFERECSIQRRHQKVIEEAPSADLPNQVRTAMGEAALNVGRSCNYVGAGTVEFLVDKDYNFYFLEMNTRLQVEHPVTEMITGIDLVAWQINIAAGMPLNLRQEDLRMQGHAIELRIYAEDPADNFMPGIGTLETYTLPSGPGIRVDNGYREGQEIPIYYDPMLAKLIVHGNNREQAISRMIAAIENYKIEGIPSTLPFGTFVLEHPVFIGGRYNTTFIAEFYKPEKVFKKSTPDEVVAEIAQQIFMDKQKKLRVEGKQDVDWLHRHNL